MKRLSFCLLLLLLTSYCAFVFANGNTNILTANFNDTKYPEGPHPNNYPRNSTGKKYDPKTAQSYDFTVNITGLENDRYYDITATLERSENKGFAANFGDNSLKDLTFLRSDYIGAKGAKLLGWDYISDTTLRFKIGSGTGNTDPNIPTSIKVRCYDWGASGKLKVIVEEDAGSGYVEIKRGEQRIPIDVNENRIADGWEKLYGYSPNTTKTDTTNNMDNSADVEDMPTGNKYPGDGWSTFEEYRGLFLSKTSQITRLKPTKKEIMVCLEDTDEANDIWSYRSSCIPSAPGHEFHNICQEFVKRPFDNPEGLLVWKRKDIG